MSRDTLPKFNWKRALRNGLGYGLALELVAIGSGYYLYREYKTNEAFRERMEEKFPVLVGYFNYMSGFYISAMPKQLRDKYIDPEDVKKATDEK